MFTFFMVLHVSFGFLLVITILLQTGKAGDLGAIFGGGASQSLFGTTGTKTILTKITIGLATAFAITSITLATIAPGKGKSEVQKHLQEQPIQPPAPQPQPPEPGK